ncbi:MAG TPA: tRNA (adenosine(37)-N6)-threonylcarbamoyltransferase complex dimerization subunit type 1 TsaB [Solirubrobacteraceae bacterium]|jgi:tRNA threonylcarbamoyladenosine biosynthesis protein TsaB
MRILAFDTATPATVVALVGDGARAESRHDPEPGERPQHVQRLLPLAAELLDAAGLAFADLDRIAVGTGPGTFTGLRIGVATARALAQASGAELAGVSTLEALAAAAAGEDREVLAVLDARRGEAFVGGAVPPAAVTPALLADIARPGMLAVGDGAVRFREVLETSGAEVPADGSPLHRVSALTVAELAAGAPPTGRDVTPEYLRLPDAEIALRERRAEP